MWKRDHRRLAKRAAEAVPALRDRESQLANASVAPDEERGFPAPHHFVGHEREGAIRRQVEAWLWQARRGFLGQADAAFERFLGYALHYLADGCVGLGGGDPEHDRLEAAIARLRRLPTRTLRTVPHGLEALRQDISLSGRDEPLHPASEEETRVFLECVRPVLQEAEDTAGERLYRENRIVAKLRRGGLLARGYAWIREKFKLDPMKSRYQRRAHLSMTATGLIREWAPVKARLRASGWFLDPPEPAWWLLNPPDPGWPTPQYAFLPAEEVADTQGLDRCHIKGMPPLFYIAQRRQLEAARTPMECPECCGVVFVGDTHCMDCGRRL